MKYMDKKHLCERCIKVKTAFALCPGCARLVEYSCPKKNGSFFCGFRQRDGCLRCWQKYGTRSGRL